MQPPPRQRTAEEERARAAAKQAEKDLWERTRGAGSAVFKLAEAGRIKPRSRNSHTGSTHSNSSGGFRSSSDSGSTAPTSDGTRHAIAQRPQGARPSDSVDEWCAEDVLPSLDEVEMKLYEPVQVPSADMLLSRGICDYTLLPKTLGRGKFSTVFVASRNGELVAIKHTALFPHHQLIATRLLREPTLLAELPPHPNLVAVKETIRTPGHFYLVEEYLDGYVTLEALLPLLNPVPPHILPTAAADRILMQLLSAVRAIHVPLQICHRDIKPENILVHPQTLQLKLLDFGLATHFSKSEAKLSTCCGSPAFHCPEIVKALASPPGSVVYMGPEVDAWTCGVTMLRCLIGARFPLGASHSSLRGMSIRAQRAVSAIEDASMREKVGALLDMDGIRRMKRFSDLVLEQEQIEGEPNRTQKKFKSTTFIPAPPTHSIKLPILESADGLDASMAFASGFATPTSASRHTTPSNSRPSSPTRPVNPGSLSISGMHTGNVSTLVALNPTNQPPDRVISFVKYCLRCAGILYHTWPDYSGFSKSNGNRHSFLGPHPSHTTTSVTTAFAEAVGAPLDTIATPSTPLFPPSFAGHEDRTDGFGHVQVFQCVVELPVEREGRDDGGQSGPMSLVQSIMAAFGRKPAPLPAPSNPTFRRHHGTSKASSPSPGPRASGKRSLSTPAQARASNTERAAGSSTAASKDVPVRCLAFHLIVRFPKQPTASMARQAMSRASSYFGPMHPGQPAWSNRARASSAAGKLSIEVGKDNEQPSLSTNHGRAESPQREYRRQTTAQEDGGTPGEEAQQPFPRKANRSPSASRPASRPVSRTRKHSTRGAPKRAKVFFQVSDERALPAVRDALSVGGTIDAQDLDDHRPPTGYLPDTTTPTAATELSAYDSHMPHGGSERRARRRTRDPSLLQIKGMAGNAAAWPSDDPTSTPSSPARVQQALAQTDAKEEQLRGRTMTSSRVRNESTDTVVGHVSGNGSSIGGLRAPSQLSTVALKEESPGSDDFRQTIDSLSRTLGEIVSGNLRSASASSASSPLTRSAVSSPRLTEPSLPSIASTDLAPLYDGRRDGMLAQTRSLLLDVSRILHRAQRRGTGNVQETLSPVLFALFSALSPALGLVPTEKIGLPASTTATDEANDATTLRGLTMSSMEIVARHASPREVVLAAQERLEVLGASDAKDGGDGEDNADGAASPYKSAVINLTADDTIATGRTPSLASSNAATSSGDNLRKTWLASLEAAGLLHVISLAMARLKTNKPLTFLEPLAKLVPHSIRGALQANQPTSLPTRTGGSSVSAPLSGASPARASDESLPSGPSQGEPSTDFFFASIEMAACECTLGIVALCRSLVDWLQTCSGKIEASIFETARGTLVTLLCASMIALLPHLPRPDGYVDLSEWSFHQWMPQYVVKRAEGEVPSYRSLERMPTADAMSAQVWTQLGELTTYMQFDVEREALARVSPLMSDRDDSSVSAATTMGAFMLHVNMLARRPRSKGASPRTGWSAAVAHDKLSSSLGLLVACFGSDVPATISKDGLQSYGGAAHLSDSALTWAMWCVEGMCLPDAGSGGAATTSTTLSVEETILFVQALATHAALCPRPAARQVSIMLVHKTLQRLAGTAIARDLLTDMLNESPYPQLRTASVALARQLVVNELTPDGKEERFASPALVNRLATSLFNLPEGLVDDDRSDAVLSVSCVKTYMDDYGAWLSECLAFVYLVTLKDSANTTGIRSSSTLQQIEQRLIQPLQAGLQRARQAIRSDGATSGAGDEAVGNNRSSVSDAAEVSLTISMLDVALERAREALNKVQQHGVVSV